MRSFRLDPYLWVHLAGLAAVPLWLDICLLGLATGEPVLPTWLELGWVAGIGVLPVAWMQWRRPFCIFSLVFLSLRPDRLSEDRRRLLRLFKDPLVKFVTALAPIPLLWALNKLYVLAPLAADLTPFGLGGRWLGLLVAAIAFLLANLFVQVPLSVLRVLLTPQRVFDQLPPYAPEQVRQDFTLLGIRINQILPDWQVPAVVPSASPVPATDLRSPSETVLSTAGSTVAPVAPRETVLDEVIADEGVSVETAADEHISVKAESIEIAAVEADQQVASGENALGEIDPVQISVAQDPSSAPEPAELGAEAAPAEGSVPETHELESKPAEPEADFLAADSLVPPAATPPPLAETAQIPELALLAAAAEADLEAVASEAADAAEPAQSSDDAPPEPAPATAGDAAWDIAPTHADYSTADSHGDADSHSDDDLLDEPSAIALTPYFDPAAPPELSDPPPTHQG